MLIGIVRNIHVLEYMYVSISRADFKKIDSRNKQLKGHGYVKFYVDKVR